MNRDADVELRAYAKSNYIRSAKATLQLLEYNAGVLEKFLYGYHKMGIKYFDPRSRDGYISIIGSRDHPDVKRNYTNAELEEEARGSKRKQRNVLPWRMAKITLIGLNQYN